MNFNSCLIVLMLMIFLNACNSSSSSSGDGGGGDTDVTSTPPLSGDVYTPLQGLAYSEAIMTGLVGEGWSVSFSGAPNWLSGSVVNGSVVITGTVFENSAKTYAAIAMTVTNGLETQSKIFNLRVLGDPLRIYQWHLENDGSHFFSHERGSAGEDMHVPPAWLDGVMGEGVRVAVSDSGVEITHADLSGNMLTGEHRNYKTGASGNGYLGNPLPYGEAHGTAVSGLIAALGWNSLGGIGVAPKAKVAGFQFLDSAQTSSILIHQTSGNFDIFNYSWGTGDPADYPDDALYIAQLRERVRNGRSGKGTLYVKAAGNEYSYYCANVSPYGNICAPQNANIPSDNNSPFLIVVGAVDAKGKAASYSNAGSNLWVAAPGGEDGDQKPAIVSTDLSGCSSGFSKSGELWAYNIFESAGKLNPHCDYTSMMNGTSSATPHTSGVIALMLSANPQLGWRDVKHILATTADRVHANSTNSNHYQTALRLSGYTYEQGWVQNAAGHYFHNWYGFGRVNAQRAVAAAKTYTDYLPPFVESNPDFDTHIDAETGLSVAIPDADPAGVSRSLVLDLGADKTTESVQVHIQVTHPRSGEVGVELISPSGTKSILLNINNALLIPTSDHPSDSNLDVVLTSHAFYGEDPNGTWTLKLVDGHASYTGQLKGWSMNVLHH